MKETEMDKIRLMRRGEEVVLWNDTKLGTLRDSKIGGGSRTAVTGRREGSVGTRADK